MGMPGSSEFLNELTSRVFGDYITEGFLTVIHDDLFIGANTIPDLLRDYERVLRRISENNLTLAPKKTVICPRSTVILGWRWSNGTISPCNHKISALAVVPPPKTCSSMRSYIGSFKALSRCIPKYASLISPLEDAIKGLDGHQRIDWDDALLRHFKIAQTALQNPETLTIPRRSDQLSLTTDASPVNKGLGATLFVNRDGKQHIAQHYSFKLKEHQLKWYPCELEALAIASAVNNFSTYARESIHPLQVLTDSKPCVQAFDKLCQGHFSASARVSTFLSTLSSYNVSVQHIPGKDNPLSDFNSRNPVPCCDQLCQICKFVNDTINSVVDAVITNETNQRNLPMPFLNKTAWRSAQHDCPDLRRAFAHLTHGTRPSRKSRDLKHLRRYLSVASLDDTGLIIVKKCDPFTGSRHLIVVPFQIIPGIVTAIHLRYNHPSKHQLKLLYDRHFFGINSESIIISVVDQCCQCNSVKSIPKEIFIQSPSLPASAPGEVFFSDILRRKRQKICVTRDVHSSFTTASIIDDETAPSLRTALLVTTSNIRSSNCTVRIDAATGFQAIRNDLTLQQHGIKLDFGHIKNKNSNSVVDKAIQELEIELLKNDPSGNAISNLQLQSTIQIMNSRIRNRGLSAREILFQRDQVTNEQLRLNDAKLSAQQDSIRVKNHLPSATSKAPKGNTATSTNLTTGDLVFIKDERNKNKARNRYVIVKIEGRYAILQNLTTSFSSRQYQVPLVNLYLACGPPNNFTDLQLREQTDSSDNDFVEEPADDLIDGEETPQLPQQENIHQRPLRQRTRPQWMRNGE